MLRSTSPSGLVLFNVWEGWRKKHPLVFQQLKVTIFGLSVREIMFLWKWNVLIEDGFFIDISMNKCIFRKYCVLDNKNMKMHKYMKFILPFFLLPFFFFFCFYSFSPTSHSVPTWGAFLWQKWTLNLFVVLSFLWQTWKLIFAKFFVFLLHPLVDLYGRRNEH